MYYILKQSKRQIAEFDALPDVERRVARGDYDFFSSVDVDLWELVQEAQRNGFILAWTGMDRTLCTPANRGLQRIMQLSWQKSRKYSWKT